MAYITWDNLIFTALNFDSGDGNTYIVTPEEIRSEFQDFLVYADIELWERHATSTKQRLKRKLSDIYPTTWEDITPTYSYDFIVNPGVLTECAVYSILSNGFAELIKMPGDEMERLHLYYKQQFADEWVWVRENLRVDVDDDDEVDDIPTFSTVLLLP